MSKYLPFVSFLFTKPQLFNIINTEVGSMKIRIESGADCDEPEVVIRCRSADDSVMRIEHMLIELQSRASLVFYKDNKEFYISLNDVLFFEASGREALAHTALQTYKTGKKLCEIAEILPPHFVRISKSAVINAKRIYSVERNITSASLVQFSDSHKQVYVSRKYYKDLKKELERIWG